MHASNYGRLRVLYGMVVESFTVILFIVLTPCSATAQTRIEQNPDGSYGGPDIIVQGVRDVVVNGRARRCRPLPNDPLDKVNVDPTFNEQPGLSSVVPAGAGKFAFEANSEQVTGPDFWQRSGVRIDQYVFRGPHGGRPLCIGGSVPDQNTFAGFRRILDAASYRGKRLRFTAWATTGGAQNVTFFLAAGKKERKLYNGGNTNNRPWGGNHGWTPVLLEIGPVPEGADHISYGFHLHGLGDVWIYKPKLEIITDEPPAWINKGDIVIIGSDKY